MTILSNIIEGLTILARYYPDAIEGEIIADGEQVWYAPYEPEKLEAHDLERLRSLNWFEEMGKWSIEIIPYDRPSKTPSKAATITGKLNPPQIRPPIVLDS